MSKEEKIIDEMQEIEAIARKGLKGEETLLSHCSMLS